MVLKKLFFMGVVLDSGALLSVCGGEPIVLATAQIVWGFPQDPLGQKLNCMKPSTGTEGFI